MFTKLIALVGSSRFWFLTLAGFAWTAERLGWLPVDVSLPLIAWFTTLAGIRTIDKFNLQ